MRRIPPATPDTEIVIFESVTITRRAIYTVDALAKITGETVEDITANVDNNTLDAWSEEYLSDLSHTAGQGIARAMRRDALSGEGPSTFAAYRML